MIIKPLRYNKVWGSEHWICNTEQYCGKLLYMDDKSEISLHFHAIKDEVFFCLEGDVMLTIVTKNGERERIRLAPGQPAYRILPCTPHSIKALSKSTIIEFSSHHEDSDSYRLSHSIAGIKE